MFFDNRNTVLRLNKIRYIVLLIFITLISIVIWSGWFENQVLGLGKLTYSITISIIYLFYLMISYILNYNFLSYKDDGNKLLIRFVSFRPFDNAKKAIEIEKKNFGGYQVQKSFFNLKTELILNIKTKNGIAKYPPISISALTKKQVTLLKGALNQYV